MNRKLKRKYTPTAQMSRFDSFGLVVLAAAVISHPAFVIICLVFASPVQSSFFALFGRTATATGCLLWQDTKKPD